MMTKARAQAVIIQNGRLLMVRHFDLTVREEYWCLPGGGVEPGESPEQAVIRELKEETGVDMRIIKRLGVDVFPEVSQGYNRAYTFLAGIVSGVPSLGYDPEYAGCAEVFLQEVSWRPIDRSLLLTLHRMFRQNGLDYGSWSRPRAAFETDVIWK